MQDASLPARKATAGAEPVAAAIIAAQVHSARGDATARTKSGKARPIADHADRPARGGFVSAQSLADLIAPAVPKPRKKAR